MKRLFTSESVTEGHPDKICDQIADAVLDAILEQDPNGRVAAEATVTTGFAMVMGEVTTSAYVDIQKIVRDVICDIGYTHGDMGFDGNSCCVLTSIDEQSSDIAMGVDNLGAGDQGLMFGYACNETPELMPLPISLAHRLARKLTAVRKSGYVSYLRPDGKTQVTVEYEDDKPVRVDAIVVSTQHDSNVRQDQLKQDILNLVIRPIVPENLIDENTKILINPTGRFVIGGPNGDSGLTGRKLIVDTYGGYARHGGGSFSGKDPTKVDRSASYAARYVAKNIVAAGLADKCEIQLAYAIGVAEPVSIMVDTFGTGKVNDEKMSEIVSKVFNLTPGGIIEMLGLRRPLYRRVAAYGHFGRTDIDVPWEHTDKTELLKKEADI